MRRVFFVGIACHQAGATVATAAPDCVPVNRTREVKDVVRVLRIERWPPGKAPDLARTLWNRMHPHPVREDPEAEADRIEILLDASDLIVAYPVSRELHRVLGRSPRVQMRALSFVTGAAPPSRSSDWRTLFGITRATSELAALLAEGKFVVSAGLDLADELRQQMKIGTAPRRGANPDDGPGDLAIAALLSSLLFKRYETAGTAGWVPMRNP
jgi:hypothetical protein